MNKSLCLLALVLFAVPVMADTSTVNFITEAQWTQENSSATEFELSYVSLQISNRPKVFVTGATYNGNLGGVSGADTKCQTAATAAGLTDNVFYSWIASNASNDPDSRFTKSSVGYELTNTSIVARSWADLTDSSLEMQVTRDENGTLVASTKVSTCVFANGSYAVGEGHCDNWTNSQMIFFYAAGRSFGLSDRDDEDWTHADDKWGCDASLPLYCFEQSDGSNATRTTTPSYVLSTNTVAVNTSNWSALHDIALNQSTPTDTSVKYLISFDGRTTWRYWNGSFWKASSLANLQADGMEKAALEGINASEWGTMIAGGTMDFALDLATTNTSVGPKVYEITLNYTEGTLALSNLSVGWVTPTTNQSVKQNKFFKVEVTVNCTVADCGIVNVSLDPQGEPEVEKNNSRAVEKESPAAVPQEQGPIASIIMFFKSIFGIN